MQQQQRITVLVAIATFVSLSVLTLVGWTLTRPAKAGDASSFERISLDDFRKMLDDGEVVVIDVRTMDAYVASHIPGSRHIPLARIEGEIAYLPKGQPVVTYCTCPSEESSGEAAMILQRHGVQAKALRGGLDAWVKAGFPTVAGVQ